MESVIPLKTSRIRLLKFLSNFLIGGTERQFVHVANGLDRSRFEVELACLRREGPLLDSLKADMPVTEYRVTGSFYKPSSIRKQLTLARNIRSARLDIVHTYGWNPNIFAVPAARLALRPRVLASIRDTGAYLTPWKIRALKLACHLADCVLANSMAGRTWLIEQGVSENKIQVVRNGIVVPAQAERRMGSGPIHREFGIPEGAPIVACVGRLVSGKGIDFFIRAARILADQRPDIRFLMIGAISIQKNYQSEMERLARELNVEGRVIFTGQRQDVPEILREVDIVVHPSLTEGLSNVILEAMAAGVPVIATNVGGNPELVQEGRNGLLVPVENAEAIVQGICRLIDDPGMARAFGAAGHQRVKEEFSIETMLRKTEELYFRLMEQPLAAVPLNRINCQRETDSFLH